MNERLRQLFERHRITFGVALALGIATVLTMASMALYVSSGASRLDLSRPGYEKARSEIGVDGKETDFSPTGPVSTSALNDFQTRFNKQRDMQSKLGNYGSTALDDNELQLVDTGTTE